MRRVRNALGIGIPLLLAWLGVLSAQILAAGRATDPPTSDVAIVLGAAVNGSRPSPVFAERINHAVWLYASGNAGKLLFTGGYGAGARHAESRVARRYATRRGIPAGDILTEAASHTTRENLVEARRVMRSNGLRTALIVSDPLHMKRALRMARDLNMDVVGAPTPTSRFRTWRTKTGFLLRELYFYHHYLVTGN